jgi:hypothetical protein
MKYEFIKMLIKAVGIVNAFPAPLTEEYRVHNIIRKLHPITTDKGLIRLGPKGDGGYLVPNDLEAVHACISPGVDKICEFEKDCADLGMKVLLADKSIDDLPEWHDSFIFIRKYLGSITNNDFCTLDDLVNSMLPNSRYDLILQMDIEGFEYEVFLSTSDWLMKRFRIIVVEFHWLHQLWNKPLFNVITNAFNKILQTHSVVHIHPNNSSDFVLRKNEIEIPSIMEFTFLRNDRIIKKQYANSFPHDLDCDNQKGSTMKLPRCWYHAHS